MNGLRNIKTGCDLLLAVKYFTGQKFLIAMKLELDLWCRLLDVYSKFQINASKHVEKKAQKTEKIQNVQK